MEYHEGTLYLEDVEPNKSGEHDWRERWFVLDEGYLRYFTSSDSLEPVATVPCRGITAKSVGKARVNKHAFRLNVTKQEDGRYKYVLAGDDEADSLTWLELLKQHGAKVNTSKIRLTARKGPEESKPAGGFASFGRGDGSNRSGRADSKEEKGGGGLMGKFLSFGAKKPAAAPKAKDDDGLGLTETEAAVTRSRKESNAARYAGGDFVAPKPDIMELVTDGEIDGDAPFHEVMKSRPEMLTRSASLTKADEEASDPPIMRVASIRKRAPTVDAPTGEEVVEVLANDVASDNGGAEEDDAELLAEMADEDVDEPPSETPDDGQVPVAVVSDEGAGNALMRGLSSIGKSLARLSGAEATPAKEEPDMTYGGNTDAPPPAAASTDEAPTLSGLMSPTALARQASGLTEGVLKRLSLTTPAEEAAPPTPTAVLEAPPEATKEEVEPVSEAEAAEAASTAAVADVADPKDVQEEDHAPPPQRPSLIARVSGVFGLSTDAPPAEPPPEADVPPDAPVADEPPTPAEPEPEPEPAVPIIEDTPAQAAVRTWFKAVLLAADDVKTLDVLADQTVGLRDTLRNGMVLIATLNALKPKAVGKVKMPTASATRFAQLEPLATYRRACAAAGLSERDCLNPEDWLDGDKLEPVYDHLAALSRAFAKAPKFVPPGGLRKAPTKSSVAGAKLGGAGVVPFESAAQIKGGAKAGQWGHLGTVTRSAAAVGNSGFMGAASNASAAKAVFEAEKGGGRERGASGGKPQLKKAESTAQRTGVQTTVRSNTGATHSFAESETIAFSEFINETLEGDPDVGHLVPIDVEAEDFTLFDVLRDGVLLCKLINAAVDDTIDMRAVNLGNTKPLSVYQVVENLNMAINAAGAIGCRVVNIGPDDILSGSPHLCLGLLWQIVKAAIMANLNLKASPELLALLGADMDDADAMKKLNALSPEKILLKWLNYQVQRVKPGHKEVTNFGNALKDCSVYGHLLSAVAPADSQHLVAGLSRAIDLEKDPIARAQLIIDTATSLGVKQFKIMPADIAKGNEKLNMAFAAAIFNALPGLSSDNADGLFQAAMSNASAEIKEGGRVVRLTETGCALFGGLMEQNTGTHWAVLKILEATEPQVYVGLMPPECNKNGVPGKEKGTTSLEGTGRVLASGNKMGDAGATYGKGDLIKVEYNADKKVLKWYKNGTEVGMSMEGGAAPAHTHFAVGRGAGIVEVRLEDSSFMSDAARGAGALLDALGGDESDSREERAFRMWINSLGLDTHVNNLIQESQDGLLILEVMDKINPGVVDWKKVAKKPKNVHEKVANCNYAVELGKKRDAFGFSLVGIGGVDISKGTTKLILAIVWQMMRYHVIKFLTSISGSAKPVTDIDVLKWANAKVATQSGLLPVNKLSDPTLASGVYILTLIKAVAPRSVDLTQVTPGLTEEEKKLNARLAISCGRRAGCMLFALWEDIVDCKPKMLLVLFATLMQLDIKTAAAASASEKKKLESSRKMSMIKDEE